MKKKNKHIQKVRLLMTWEDDKDDIPIIVRQPEDIYGLAFLTKELVMSDREKLICLHLDMNNQVISYEVISVGNLYTTTAHPREVFKGAILANAASIIIAHNHPSGDATPSTEDVQITRRIQQSGHLLGIELLDHIVFGSATFASLKEKGLM